MLQKAKERYDKKVLEAYAESLSSFSDLIGDGYTGMSPLFYLLNRRFLHWLDDDPAVAVSEKEIRFRKRFYPVLQAVGPGALKCTQVFENRRRLMDPSCDDADTLPQLTDSPVIFVANHGFHDDVLASVLAARRVVYIAWGSLPLLYNTFDGFASSLVGCVCLNRKSGASRKAFTAKALRAMEHGMSILAFPEGGWNKTSELLALPLWKGVYDLSAASGCPVVPITLYVRDPEVLSKKNIIHTVVDDPISLYDMPRQEALRLLRDTFATWTYTMMEAYGRSTREIEMGGYTTSDQRWHAHLRERMKGVARYDSSIEKRADYRLKDVTRPEDAFASIAAIREENITPQNVKMVLAARQLVEERQNSDFQRLY